MAVVWGVISLNTTTTVGSLSDVVTDVHWYARDQEIVDLLPHIGHTYGVVALAEPDSSSFTAINSITEENAIAWAKAALGSDQVTSIEAGIAAQITESKTPTTTSGVPW